MSANAIELAVKLENGILIAVSGKSEGKDLTSDQIKEINTYFLSSKDAVKKANEVDAASLGILSGLMASFGL